MPNAALAGSVSPDALSQLLDTVRLRGDRIYRTELHEPAAIRMPAGTPALHLVEHGRVVVSAEGAEDLAAEAGDLVLLAGGPGHLILVGGAKPAAARDLDAADLACEGHEPVLARWMTGTLRLDRAAAAASRLLQALPQSLILRGQPGDPREWLDVSSRLIIQEVVEPLPGAAVMVSRIVDLLFIQTLRAWAASPDARPSWITAAMDPLLSQALTAIHREPAHPWTVDSLAAVAGLSRSAFADRFTRSVGRPPAEYLNHHRLDLACGLLRESALPVRTVAARVGYSSEAAFSRAFRRRFGDSPLHWRKQQSS